MAVTCPVCGNSGEIRGTEETFEVRGQYAGKAVRKCRNCGAGLLVGPFSGGFLGRPKPIDPELWREMERRWEAEFGE